jgi:hypothetical protein
MLRSIKRWRRHMFGEPYDEEKDFDDEDPALEVPG